MQRYFVDNTSFHNDQIMIASSDVHHITTVMRYQVGDEIIVCNQSGTCMLSVIQELNPKHVVCRPMHPLQDTSLPIRVDIAQALIRRERFEYMIQKSTELGVNAIIPTMMTYNIVKWNDQKEDKKIARWNTLAKEASEQSHRNTLSTVESARKLNQLSFGDYDVVFVAYEKETQSTVLAQVLEEPYHKILLVIGPEGGFHPDEIKYLATIENVRFVGLGKRILRSETASTFLLSVLAFQYEMRNPL